MKGFPSLDMPMFRLTILLILAMAVAWHTLGRDHGQLRPGLAQAAAEGRLDEVWAEARAREAATVARRAALAAPPAPVRPRVPVAPVVAAPEPVAPPLVAAPVVQPERQVVQVLEDPVFSLESYGNEAVPGEDQANAAEAPSEGFVPVGAETGEPGRVLYVIADSVNVRAGPSTDADILGKLSSGETLVLVANVDDEWSRIVIEGDGVEGYIATRFLSSVAP